MEELEQNSYINKNDIGKLYLLIKNSKNRLEMEKLLYQWNDYLWLICRKIIK